MHRSDATVAPVAETALLAALLEDYRTLAAKIEATHDRNAKAILILRADMVLEQYKAVYAGRGPLTGGQIIRKLTDSLNQRALIGGPLAEPGITVTMDKDWLSRVPDLSSVDLEIALTEKRPGYRFIMAFYVVLPHDVFTEGFEPAVEEAYKVYLEQLCRAQTPCASRLALTTYYLRLLFQSIATLATMPYLKYALTAGALLSAKWLYPLIKNLF